MPRPTKGARLWLRPEERSPDGQLRKRAVWCILDGARKVSTGCPPEDRDGAERALGRYIADKHEPDRTRGRHPSEILIADVLAIYLIDKAPNHAREEETRQRVLTLDSWWTDKTLSEVTGPNCRAYVDYRTQQAWKSSTRPDTPKRMVTASAARRELEDLRAAINHHRKEGLCSELVSVVLPEKALPRERWLTRSEAAQVLRKAWRATQLMQDRETRRAVGRHAARFILVGLYTGTRAGAICGAALRPTIGRGWVDLERGVFHRKAIGRRATKKRQPPVRIPPRLLAHMRRWVEKGISKESVIEWNGKPIASVRKAFATAVRAAGLGPEVTPHVLRHTAATWLMREGADIYAAAGFLGMTPQQLQDTYGHHHPDFQVEVAELISGRRRT